MYAFKHRIYFVFDSSLDMELPIIAPSWRDAFDTFAQTQGLTDYREWLQCGLAPLTLRSEHANAPRMPRLTGG